MIAILNPQLGVFDLNSHNIDNAERDGVVLQSRTFGGQQSDTAKQKKLTSVIYGPLNGNVDFSNFQPKGDIGPLNTWEEMAHYNATLNDFQHRSSDEALLFTPSTSPERPVVTTKRKRDSASVSEKPSKRMKLVPDEPIIKQERAHPSYIVF